MYVQLSKLFFKINNSSLITFAFLSKMEEQDYQSRDTLKSRHVESAEQDERTLVDLLVDQVSNTMRRIVSEYTYAML